MSFNRKILSLFLYPIFLACILPIAIFSSRHQEYNWDMLGYMALVIRMDGAKDIKETHADVRCRGRNPETIGRIVGGE